ncbi:hypothetical protein SEA_DIRTMONSTER_91 [Mycobacterium phage DirtMonster]|uniref:ARB-07466-like C-terminal domain-containing protein n=10 Tax=Bixzunavirus TaxID=680114 RepID=B5LK80_9CAUD|nr:gp94 [Mycobacterium phage Rizal]YP_008060895.1 hypothetical protein M181_gp232 [Mycobacterium phage Gizmo]YP_008061587.1 hypothetical protein M182_gp223 [Mycobacterium phage Astraea]YP_009221223.1 hypothetical protein AWH68_gp227 [Mycobacterium phage Breeniome]YP_010057498.1 hypothetical protein KHO60_gp222 [Mycobacterium phage CharlieB]YP_010057970.1 hypothetical protein KHO62_gp216 [Mycobacterium phage NoodleTree]AEJ94798.1 hypothetical protein GHOST_97 [Mycobacterium phage Ghost]AER496
MATKHVLHAERRDVTTRPTDKAIRRKLKHAETLGDFKMRPGYLYTVVRAISARVNQNYDGWPSDELKKAAHTFIGKPVFVNHENYDPKKARGVVVAARYVENGNDKFIEVIQEIDAKRFPKLAHEIRTGGLDSVSMGAEAGFTICSYCGNKATDVPEMCDHVLYHKGERLPRHNRKTGKVEDVLVYESCHKISFFELSYVFDPADETAVASRVLVANNKTAGYEDELAEWNHYRDEGRFIRPGQTRRLSDDLYEGPRRDLKDHPVINDFHRSLWGDNFPAEMVTEEGLAPDPPSSSQAKDYLHYRSRGANPPDDDEVQALTEYAKGRDDQVGGDWNSWWDWDNPESSPGYKEFFDWKNKNASRTAAAVRTAADCPPGQDCTVGGKPEDQITPDSANNPVNGGSNDSSSVGGGGAGASAGASTVSGGELGKPGDVSDASGLKGDAVTLKNLYESEGAGSSVGGYSPNVDQPWDEHQTGYAIDLMSPTNPDKAMQDAFANGANYVLWQQKQWNPDGSISDMPDRGSPTENHFDHMHINTDPGKRAKVAKAVRKYAGAATKCHYCSGDAEVGFSSCAAHRPMEEKKFRAAQRKEAAMTFEASVIREFLGGPPPPARPMTGIEHQPGLNPEDYVVPYKGRGYQPGMPVDVYRNLHSEKTGTGLWSVRHKGQVVGHADFIHMPQGKFFVGEGGNAKVQETGQKNVHAGARGVLGPVPHDHDPSQYVGITYNPKAGDTSFYQRETKEPVWEADHVHLGPDGKAYTLGPRSGMASADQKVFEAMVLQAYGETEAPTRVDTLREEGSAPEDDNNDFYHYVEPPKELQTPDLSEAAQIDRQQAENQGDTMDVDGDPGPHSVMNQEPVPGAGGAPQQQFMTLQIPIPPQGQAPGVPMQSFAPPAPAPAPPMPPQQIAASTLDFFDRYYGRRVANWLDAIEAGREFTAEEASDYRREAMKLSTLQKAPSASTTSRNPMKGTANMARSNLASRGKVVTAGRRQHFAEGPLVDSGDQSRNDQGEQEEAFISTTPPEESVVAPTDDTPNISNTEQNLVARVKRGRAQLMADAQKLAQLQAQRQRRMANEAGGPVATEVNPTVNSGPGAEELTGDDFESANPNDGVVETQPKDASLHAFRTFDSWLKRKTGKSARYHTSATIRRAADDFSRQSNVSVQALFPALGIVLREARKNEKAAANTKGANMRKRADEKLEVAAPDGRVDVEAPTRGTTDAEAQASQFDLNDFGNNAGDNIADPDLSTDQNWAPGEAKKSSKVKTAGGVLAFRLAEAMIAAGIEPNTVERKYALAAEFENMNRGAVQDRIALCERFVPVLAAARRQVASGSTRGAALKSPIPSGLVQGAQRTAGRAVVAANDPRNDASLFI